MDYYRLLILAVLFVARQTVKGEADEDHASSNEAKDEEVESERNLTGELAEPITYDQSEWSLKLKRQLSIVGPIPSGYQGQASGRTTFDGIRTSDLQLPGGEVSGFRGESQQFGGGFGFGGEQQPSKSSFSPSGFAAESASDVYNFDGKEPVTYDGVLSSDLMVPLPHITKINPVPFGQPSISRPGPVSRLAEPIDSISPEGLTLPALTADQQVYNRPNTPEPFNHQLRDASLFRPETPTERYNRLHEQYQATLEEYRQSLARFRQQLQKYTTLSRHKK